MDLTDMRIIRMLDANCRVSYQEMASGLGLSANAVKKRVAKLIEEGRIVGFRVLPSLAMMGATLVLAIIYTNGSESREETVNHIGGTPVFHHISTVAGTEGGTYFAIGRYIGLEQLSDVTKKLREIPEVRRIEIHNLLFSEGTKIDLSRSHVRVLKHLREDPRMSIADLARNTGFTAKRVRRLVSDLAEDRAFRFRIRWNMSTGKDTQFLARIEYEEAEVSGNDIFQWLLREYPMRFWEAYISSTEPIVFGNFVTDTLRDAEDIVTQIRQSKDVKSATTYVCFSNTKFQRIGDSWMEKLILDSSI
ncbi:MAG: winged helix-turn-helix transcriptional regulator [Candidatus Thorarchaeota archaeon]